MNSTQINPTLLNAIQKSPIRLITLEGGISVGKTTLGRCLNKLFEKLGIPSKFYTEPFNQNMLEQFLGDKKKYAYAFQLYMLTRRQLDYNEAYRDKASTTAFLDRSMTGDYVFMSLQHEEKNVSDKDFEIYKEEYEKFDKYKPDMVIYLNVDVDIMKKRIEKRNRKGENVYDFGYLDKLQKQYKMILPEHIPYKNLIKIDWTDDVIDSDGNVREEVLYNLLEQIYMPFKQSWET
jgi:deoxyadenosine/deoxycytidine kinase